MPSVQSLVLSIQSATLTHGALDEGGGGWGVPMSHVDFQKWQSGADTGFRKGGGDPGNCKVLKCSVYAGTRATFFSLFMKFGGPPKGGGGGPDPKAPPLDPPLAM